MVKRKEKEGVGDRDQDRYPEMEWAGLLALDREGKSLPLPV